jgi:16S rRNA C1402 N4-methylase RsmH
MPLPSIPRYKRYRGSKPQLQRKNAQEIETAHRIAKEFFRRVADNPLELQVHYFATIAADLGVTTEQVRAAIGGGGYNGITLRIDQTDRRELERYKSG